ncbi:MAG TPA: heme A synthase [Xanthomonadales bacterium]|nr:heme A synthase [Xanthomonadales bacterium]
MNLPHRHFHRIAWAAVALAFAVIVFGAFVRLSDAGLGCPDWPTCYGQATWPRHDVQIEAANQHFERPVEVDKAWKEQVHRHAAAGLGVLTLILALLTVRRQRIGLAVVVSASAMVAASIRLYMLDAHIASSVLVGLAQVALWVQVLRTARGDPSRLAVATLAVIIVQAMLGMWTVTWLLKPIVVMGHLVGGLTVFSMLLWQANRATPGAMMPRADSGRIGRLLLIGLLLLTLQIALGGWTSANYAALACGTSFPTCQGQWWPQTDFGEAFVLWRGIGVDYEGGVLDGAARTAIHLSHRLMAVLVFVYLLYLAIRLRRLTGLAGWGWLLALALGLQVALGIGNVVFGLPLWMATAHNAGAVLLLSVLVALLARLRPSGSGRPSQP